MSNLKSIVKFDTSFKAFLANARLPFNALDFLGFDGFSCSDLCFICIMSKSSL